MREGWEGRSIPRDCRKINTVFFITVEEKEGRRRKLVYHTACSNDCEKLEERLG